jgi:transposase-like protein
LGGTGRAVRAGGGGAEGESVTSHEKTDLRIRTRDIRIAELKAELEQLQKTFREISDTNDELDRENAILRKALADIADADEYVPGLAAYARWALARIPEAKP